MTGLASLFARVTEGLAPDPDSKNSGFPVSGKPEPKQQVVVDKSISGISGISGHARSFTEFPVEEHPRARADAWAGGRARGPYVGSPEMPETPEKLAGSEASLSGSHSKYPENRKRERAEAVLPADTAFDERAAFLEYECGLPRAEAERQAHDEMARSASVSLLLPDEDGLPLWRAGLATLCAERAPCPGFRGSEWSATLVRALAFLDTFGERAVALGWTASRLFGVHPIAGIVRVDVCGALVLPIAGPVRAITATAIAFGHLTHREKPGQFQGVPIWGFVEGAEQDCLRFSSIAGNLSGTGAEEVRAMACSAALDRRRPSDGGEL